MTHEDLKNIRRKRQHVNTLQERIDRLRSGAEYPLRRLGELCSVSNDVRDKLAEDVAKIVDLEHELALEVLALEQDITAVDQALSELPENQEKVLRLRYCDGLPWKLVAVEARYCMDWCKQLDGKFRKQLTQTHVFL